MKIEAIHLRRYRGISSATLDNCANLNVIIGRNNSGKSTILSAIEMTVRHLNEGKIGSTQTHFDRPDDIFNARNVSRSAQIGITFRCSNKLVVDTIQHIQNAFIVGNEPPNAERLTDQISVIFCADKVNEKLHFCISDISIGTIDASSEIITTDGYRLLR